ncbi:hypothetical protein IEQ34_003592 [Dendrobium chrysotoxum]|uniref:Uncharacterized protein n=1 Tax=Dendrobium chrysotoxum TaxID=161865 RepID=A0AAV7HLH6_DENCH|nr:hypothetical protein IEQ34_003592 [Dendrobium chrysotoxum]
MGGQQERSFVMEVIGQPTNMGDLLGKESGKLEKEGDKPSHGDRVEERWDSHPRYTRETWRDHNNRYTGGGRSY